MFVNLLLLLAALCLSGIAGYYSVIGMGTLFAAAWWPVVIMMGTLEFSKIIVASWLYRNWHHTPKLLKAYLTTSVVVLMFITSLGIFGFLSKAHIEQAAEMGDTALFISQIDQQIEVEKNRIDDSRKVIAQMDDAVNSLLSQSTAASTQKANKGAALARQATNLRAKQKPDRDALNAVIDESNTKIQNLTSEKVKLEQEKIKFETKVGPIKYVAEMIYGDNPDKNLLEKAVRYVIILIILVFDPLAVLMIIAANLGMSVRQKEKNSKVNSPPSTSSPVDDSDTRDVDPVKSPEIKMTYSEAIKELSDLDSKNQTGWVNLVHPFAYNFPITYPKGFTLDNTTNNSSDTSSPITSPEKVDDKDSMNNSQLENKFDLDDSVQMNISEPIFQENTSSIQQDNVQEKNSSEKIDEISLQSTEDQDMMKRTDVILQTIKQYHNVRLDDAKRTFK